MLNKKKIEALGLRKYRKKTLITLALFFCLNLSFFTSIINSVQKNNNINDSFDEQIVNHMIDGDIPSLEAAIIQNTISTEQYILNSSAEIATKLQIFSAFFCLVSTD